MNSDQLIASSIESVSEQVHEFTSPDNVATTGATVPAIETLTRVFKLPGFLLSLISKYFLYLFNRIFLILPSSAVRILSKNFQITLSLSSLLISLTLLIGVCFLIVRYKYLTGYSKNTKGGSIAGVGPGAGDLGLAEGGAGTTLTDSIHNSLRSGNSSLDLMKKNRRGRSTYLDEFLSAIKVFGYLERAVFHELTKNMTTQRVAEDEILQLDEKRGFSIVVEGVFQVYIKVADEDNKQSGSPDSGASSTFSDLDYETGGDILRIGNSRYQLLNEVKSGAPLSSLMSTLDLFKASKDESVSIFNPDPLSPFRSAGSSEAVSPIIGPSDGPRTSTESKTPLIIARPKVDRSKNSKKSKPSPNSSGSSSSATIAIIPRHAFERVQAKYPRATSHIVTMVLTRLYKVTMNTINNYLGLTREIIEAEIKLNKDCEATQLPSYLRDGVVERFHKSEVELSTSEGGSKGNLSGSNAPTFPTRPQTPPIIQSQSSTNLLNKPIKIASRRSTSSRYVVLASRYKATHPGDLLSSVPLSRRSDYYQTHSGEEVVEQPSSSYKKDSASPAVQSCHSKSGTRLPSRSFKKRRSIDRTFSSDREETEETSLRIAIVENLFKLLGISERELTQLMGTSNPSSRSSSIVGLSSLVASARPRMSSFHSSSPQYDTINVSEVIEHERRLSNHTSPRPFLNGASSPKTNKELHPDFDFDSVKDEFSQVIQIKQYAPNSVIVEQGKFNSGLYYVIDGELDVIHLQKSDDEEGSTTTSRLYSVGPGGLAGYLSSIVGFRSLVSIKSSTSSKNGAIVAHISKKDFTKLTDKFYYLLLPVASRMKEHLSSKIRTIDFALEWCHIKAGDVLCSQGDLANGFHMVLSGRFRVVRKEGKKSDDNLTILGEYGHGTSIGEVEVLTASRRTNSLIAIRDSETARIPRTLFEMLSIQNPSIMIKVSRIVAKKVLSASNNPSTGPTTAYVSSSTSDYLSTSYKTITILPTTAGLPVREFSDKLVHALRSIGRKVISLDQASTLTHLGRHAFDERLSQLKLSGYFAYLEEEYETVVYVCDSPVKSNWTLTCMSQGDCILLLADADDHEIATTMGEYERLLIKQKTTARTELCLIHPERYVAAGSTSIWLKNRIWVQGHHHIHMEMDNEARNGGKLSRGRVPGRTSALFRNLAAKISNETFRARIDSVKSRAISSFVKLNMRLHHREYPYKPLASHKNDFLRLARLLSNEAVGLVLGGGGSRGISHVGIVVALEKHGIPVDIIGGTSIGSFVGGLYAKDYNSVSIYGRAKIFSLRVSSLWRSLLDLTYPVTSYITGYEFNRGIWKTFGFAEIEDFWIRYFCNSTNITNSTMDIHEKGYSWRFIRASMSLAGLLPPIAHEGCMLLDGGYLDNLPVMEMKKKGAKFIIAVDVGSVDDRTPMNYGDTLSGFWVLFNRWNPFSTHPNVPNMMDIQMRLAYVASVNALEIAKNTPGVLYLRPPIDHYATLDFAKFDEIYHVGMDYADKLFTSWEQKGTLPAIAGMVDKSKEKDPHKFLHRRNSI
ncbi:lysophospholipase Nte1p [[Candida] anglica]|uniref:Lysophospholipase NTE1 n=1 Tax=[Candida] anglica TaxID=148631 RepID=A0ABP0EID7_9ASCO